MGEVDAVGEALSGALIAREVDRAADGGGAVGADGHTHEQACLNCGTALTGAFCHKCGQHGHVHRTLSAFFHDLLHAVFHFEGRFWNTLPLLVWRPGELTRRYVDGQRARFVSPMALFLFSVFLMFAVLGSVGATNPIDSEGMRAELQAGVAKNERELAELERARQAAAARGAATETLDRQIKSTRDDLATIRRAAESGMISGNRPNINRNLPAWLRDPLVKGSQNPALLFYKLRTNAYKWSWTLIPLSVPFLWLLFPFSRRFRLYDHMVFVTYSLSFMTLLVIITTVVMATVWKDALAVALFVPPIHMYRQLRGAYALPRFGALWRTVLLTWFALAAALLFIAIIVGLGLFD